MYLRINSKGEITLLNNIFDSHSHYDDERFDEDRDELLSTISKKGVCGIIHASTDLESSKRGISYTEKFPNFYTSIGIHPENVVGIPDDYILQLEELSKHKKVVAIGEIGIDYYWTKDTKELQLEIFEKQLKLANKLNLPVIVHSREATEDSMRLLNKYKPKGVVHCFSGSAETAKEILQLGMYISFTGVLTFPKSNKAQNALMAIPMDKLLLETDCPYMAPVPNRGKRCDSSMIGYIAEKVGELKGISPQEVLDITTQNTRELFNI